MNNIRNGIGTLNKDQYFSLFETAVKEINV